MSRSQLLLFLLILASCKTPAVVSKTVPAPPPSPRADESAAILDSIRHRQLQFEYLTAKAKVQVATAAEQTDFTANIRMKCDSAIWVSISPALGVEAVRLLMTTDSIRVIERLNKKRYSRDYGFFKTYTTLPVDFSTMQNLITGYPVFLQDRYRVAMNDSLVSLFDPDSPAADSLVVNRSYLTVFRQLTDSGSAMSAINDQFDIQYNPPFSLWRKITLYHKSEMTIEITFSRIKLNEPVKFPFKSEE
jgi:hypothetical protein